jgi:four helix bundle suffix protein
MMIGLIRVTTFLLYKQIQRLENDFLKEGGLKEKMTQARLSIRKKT